MIMMMVSVYNNHTIRLLETNHKSLHSSSLQEAPDEFRGQPSGSITRPRYQDSDSDSDYWTRENEPYEPVLNWFTSSQEFRCQPSGSITKPSSPSRSYRTP
ncbi:jg3756 [Pararge aegeria aegeria]|uniref:Jg3756 protein n=1 Tax=Pararge aegeria aegeria TaxID=348720 RepID=A0A8S4QBL3_9NEOP|nr:jg3756 [Pararge aegeria aegeria]